MHITLSQTTLLALASTALALASGASTSNIVRRADTMNDIKELCRGWVDSRSTPRICVKAGTSTVFATSPSEPLQVTHDVMCCDQTESCAISGEEASFGYKSRVGCYNGASVNTYKGTSRCTEANAADKTCQWEKNAGGAVFKVGDAGVKEYLQVKDGKGFDPSDPNGTSGSSGTGSSATGSSGGAASTGSSGGDKKSGASVVGGAGVFVVGVAGLAAALMAW